MDENAICMYAQLLWSKKKDPLNLGALANPAYLGHMLKVVAATHPDIKFFYIRPRDYAYIRSQARDIIDIEPRAEYIKAGVLAYLNGVTLFHADSDPAFDALKPGTVWGVGPSVCVTLDVVYQEKDLLKAAWDSLVGVTPGPWYVEESERSWELYARNVLVGIPDMFGNPDTEVHPWKLAKCPKKSTEFAEYWPKDADARFIVSARKLVPELAESLKSAEVCCEHVRAQRDEARAELELVKKGLTMFKQGWEIQNGAGTFPMFVEITGSQKETDRVMVGYYMKVPK